MRIAVIGAGGWGTTIAELLGKKGFDVSLWVHGDKTFEEILNSKENKSYLRGVSLEHVRNFTMDMWEAIEGASLVVLAIPVQKIRENICNVNPTGKEVVLNVSKGIEIKTFMRVSELIMDIWKIPVDRVATLSGPNFSYEIAREMPAATVIGCTNEKTAKELQDIFMNDYLRVYYTSDVVGVELGGALKNVYAIGTGISDGLGFGDSSKASLIVRSILEMIRLGEVLGGKKGTFVGLSGIGDLIATSFSKRSRNRWAGEEIGKGKSREDIEEMTTQVVEGLYTLEAIYSLKEQLNIDMPVIEAIYNIVYRRLSPFEELAKLMRREKKREDTV